MVTSPVSPIVIFQAVRGDDQTTVLPHREQGGPLIPYLQTPPTETSTPTTTQSHGELDKAVFEVGRGRESSTSSWVGKGLFRSVWKDPSTLDDVDAASRKSIMAAQMRECEIIVRLAKDDPTQPDTPAALREIFDYFADVLMVGGDYEYSLKRLTVCFLWGSSDWDTLGDVPSSCHHALESLIGLRTALSTLELEGVDQIFAGQFAKGLTGKEEVIPVHPVIAPYKPDLAEMEKKGEPYLDWEVVKPLSGGKTLRKTLTFDVRADEES